MADPKVDVGTEKRTLVEEGTQFKGSLTSNCPIVVKGRIEGDVSAPSLTVSVSGAVHGKAKVGEIRSMGELSGDFDADVVQLSGTVRDNTVIRAKSLEVKLAPTNGKMQVVFGECVLDVGDTPSKTADPPRSEAPPREQPTGKAARAAAAAAASADPPPPPPPKNGGGTIPPPALSS
jgi:cytoskeletal protein CcmA (bactofilin family)